jgi:hypothetical protein
MAEGTDAGIAEEWDDSDDEYAVLVDLALPAVLERFTSGRDPTQIGKASVRQSPIDPPSQGF